MKKIICIVLVLMVTFCFAGCGAKPVSRDDFYFYRDGQVTQNPDMGSAEQDGLVASSLTDETTYRGIKYGSTRDDLKKAYGDYIKVLDVDQSTDFKAAEAFIVESDDYVLIIYVQDGTVSMAAIWTRSAYENPPEIVG